MTKRIIFSGLCFFMLTATTCEYIDRTTHDAPDSVPLDAESQSFKVAHFTDQGTLLDGTEFEGSDAICVGP